MIIFNAQGRISICCGHEDCLLYPELAEACTKQLKKEYCEFITENRKFLIENMKIISNGQNGNGSNS